MKKGMIGKSLYYKGKPIGVISSIDRENNYMILRDKRGKVGRDTFLLNYQETMKRIKGKLFIIKNK